MTNTPPPGFGPRPDPDDPPLPPGFSPAALSQSPGVYQPPSPPSPKPPPVRKRGRGKLAILLVVPLVVIGLWARSCVSEGKEATDAAREAIEEIGDGVADPADYTITEDSCENSEQVRPGAISPIARGTVTNTSGKVNSFVVEVKFTGEGGDLLATETDSVLDLEPGESGTWRVWSAVVEDGDTFTCAVSETYYNVPRLAPSGN